MPILDRGVSNIEHLRAYGVNTRDGDHSLAHQQQQRRSISTCNLICGRDDDNQQSALKPTSTEPTLHLAVRR